MHVNLYQLKPAGAFFKLVPFELRKSHSSKFTRQILEEHVDENEIKDSDSNEATEYKQEVKNHNIKNIEIGQTNENGAPEVDETSHRINLNTQRINLNTDYVSAIPYLGKIIRKNISRYKLFFDSLKQYSDKYSFDLDLTTRALYINNTRFVRSKKILQFLMSDKAKKPDIPQLDHFLNIVRKLPNKCQKHLSKNVRQLLN